MNQESKQPKIPKDTKPATRPSQDSVRENAEKWALSTGLQPPK
jgi:hypothetical protein